jgi:hypothetical protein
MTQSILTHMTQLRNTLEFFLGEQTERSMNTQRIRLPRIPLYLLGIALAIALTGCVGPSKVALIQQFDARIGQHKDLLILELGLPTRNCTPLKFGEACEWTQIGGPPFLEGPLKETFPGDALTYFLNSKRIVCQWRFQGRRNGTQQSKSQC